MSSPNQILEAAAELPLYDAAYELWVRRRELDRLEQSLPQASPQRLNLNEPEIFKKVVNEALDSVLREQATAHDGPTFDRLKKAHPASDADLKAAIKAAVKLEQDCLKHFSYKSPNYHDDVQLAVDLARQENPGFQERTYRLASNRLSQDMR